MHLIGDIADDRHHFDIPNPDDDLFGVGASLLVAVALGFSITRAAEGRLLAAQTDFLEKRLLAGCVATAAVVRVETEASVTTSLFRPHSFLGVLATEFIAGTQGEEVRVRVDWASGARTDEVISPDQGRHLHVAHCLASGGR